jgi:hypothetical protein
MSQFSMKHQQETEEKNARIIKVLQAQGDLPEEGPWEHVNINGHTLDYYTCENNACGRITFKVDGSKIVLCQFYPVVPGVTNISRCDACAKCAGIRRH